MLAGLHRQGVSPDSRQVAFQVADHLDLQDAEGHREDHVRPFSNKTPSESLLTVALQLDLLHHPAFLEVHVSFIIKLSLYC